MFGRIPFPGRLQRIGIGVILILLTILGLLDESDWKKWTALAVQIELLLTGLAGWCPVYWACRVSSPSPPSKNTG